MIEIEGLELIQHSHRRKGATSHIIVIVLAISLVYSSGAGWGGGGVLLVQI
jgi:hypothetical protein